ncbi:MAG: uroporphyrinogen-III synthase [Anaerolineales bacterium]|nr:uroporphyrinogen-III synthase [Anaerolineales bacterium]MDP2776670.1 uroporphyrinogen-III synthase [Anaerolineales bacterium]
MKVLITRPRAQSESFGEALHAAGFEPIYFPVIEIRPMGNNAQLDRVLNNLNKYDWVVFTSVNSVDVVFGHGRPQGSPLRVAAIGPKTAEALRKHNIEPEFIPEEYIAEAILPGLGDLKNKWVLLPRAEIARKELPEAIVKAGGSAHEIVVYQTLPAEVDMDGLAALKSGVDVITFTSASTVENFVAIGRQNKLDPLKLPNNPLFACIGPITEQAAREVGLSNIVVAKEYTTDGLIKAIANLEKL